MFSLKAFIKAGQIRMKLSGKLLGIDLRLTNLWIRLRSRWSPCCPSKQQNIGDEDMRESQLSG